MSDHIKQQIKGKMQERDRLEANISECTTRLEASGAGLHNQLIDKEGFPRADIDVSAVRADRHKVAVLTNDHKRITNQIEQLMHELHAEVRKAPAVDAAQRPRTTDASSSLAAPAQPAATVTSAAASAIRPFAVIDEMSASSPAEEAGLQVGDQLISFADVSAQTANTLPSVAATLQANENREVEARLLRRGSALSVKLTPHTWGGRGLLGCHLRPI